MVQIKCYETWSAKEIEDIIYPLLEKGWALNPRMHTNGKPWEMEGTQSVEEGGSTHDKPGTKLVWNMVLLGPLESDPLAAIPALTIDLPADAKLKEPEAWEGAEDMIVVKLEKDPGGPLAQRLGEGWMQIDFNKVTREAILKKPKTEPTAKP